MLDILNNSAAKSGLIAFKAPYVFQRDFTTNFSVKWMHKDVGLILESRKELGRAAVPLTALTQQLFRTAIAKGLGGRGFVLYYQGVRGDWRVSKVKSTSKK